MNSEEGTSMAKMAVTVLLVVLVIAAVVSLVYAAYSWFGSGTDKLTDTVTSIDKSAYSQYDDSQVSGTDVLSALKNYRESDIAIFVSNKGNGGYDAYSNGSGNMSSMTACNYCALITGVSANSNNNYVTSGQLTCVDGVFYCDDFQYDSTGIATIHNTNFSPTTTTSNSEAYVKQSAKWYAKLVYSTTTEDIAGILFMQMN